MKKCIIGTTLLIAKNNQRYINWLNYYGSQLPDYHLILVNDGATEENRACEADIRGAIDLAQDKVTFIYCNPKLGRYRQTFIFPGWRRSFREGLRYAANQKYNVIIHIETDLYIRAKFINKYKEIFEQPGYISAYCHIWDFIEPSLQVINDKDTLTNMISFFDNESALNAKISAEQQIQDNFKPRIAFKGIRYDQEIPDMEEWEYYAQADFDKFKEFIL